MKEDISDMTACDDFVALLDNLDNDPLYLEKMMMDDEMVCEEASSRVCCRNRECSWIRNRKFKKKLKRRFLSQNPVMDLTKLYGCRAERGWYISVGSNDDYDINPITHVYLSRRGDIRVLHAAIPMHNNRIFLLSTRKEIKAINIAANRKNRHMKINEDEDTLLQHSLYKKLAKKQWW